MKADPRLISDFEDKMDAVVQCYLPRMKGKSFSYSFGDVNPSGRLPYNYPRYPNSLEKYNRKHTESLATEEQNDDAKYQSYQPQYEFAQVVVYDFCLFKS
jgi:beta-glucosidase